MIERNERVGWLGRCGFVTSTERLIGDGGKKSAKEVTTEAFQTEEAGLLRDGWYWTHRAERHKEVADIPSLFEVKWTCLG